MRRYYLNRELAGRLHLPLSRWKRWSREFLPPDPLGGLQSGYARQYSLKDAFTVYLGGYLVSMLGFSIPDGRRILQDLDGWLKKSIVARIEAAADEPGRGTPGFGAVDILIFPVQSRTSPAFTYRIRTLLEQTAVSERDPGLRRETYREEILKPGEPIGPRCYPACARHVALSDLAGRFYACLTA